MAREVKLQIGHESQHTSLNVILSLIEDSRNRQIAVDTDPHVAEFAIVTRITCDVGDVNFFSDGVGGRVAGVFAGVGDVEKVHKSTVDNTMATASDLGVHGALRADRDL